MRKKGRAEQGIKYTALVDYEIEDGTARKYYVDDSGLYQDPDEFHEHYYERDIDLVDIFGGCD